MVFARRANAPPRIALRILHRAGVQGTVQTWSVAFQTTKPEACLHNVQIIIPSEQHSVMNCICTDTAFTGEQGNGEAGRR